MNFASGRIGKVVVLTLGNGLNVLMNFIALPFLVRSLSFVEYGSYGQVFLLMAFFQGVFTYSLNQVSNIYLSNKSLDTAVVFRTLTVLLFGLSALGAVFFCVTAHLFSYFFGNEDLSILIILSSLNLFAQVFIPVLMSVLYFAGRYNSTTVVSVLVNCLKLLAMYFAVNYFSSLKIMLAALSLVSLLQLVILYLLVPGSMKANAVFDMSLSRAMLSSGTPLTFSSLIERSLFHIDGFLISALLSTSAFAIYRAGALEVPFISGVYGAVTAILLPEIARMNAEGKLKEIVNLKRLAISSTAFFVYPVLVFLLFFSGDLITIYLSERYLESALVFSIFNLALFVRVNDFQDVLVLNGHGRYITLSVIVSAITNLLLNIFLIRLMGIPGGAIAFILSLFLFAGMLFRKSLSVLHCRVDDMVDTRALAFLLIISSLIAFLSSRIILHFHLTSWSVVFISPIYFCIVFLMGWKLNLLPEPIKQHILDNYLKKKS
jgi:O-antigen/teichoic acid export membrane protein